MTTYKPHAGPCLAALVLAAALAGCSTQLDQDAPLPPRLSIKLHTATVDQRVTYFDLKRDGQLYFAGGSDAVYYRAKPIRTLTEAQREALWRIIVKHQLLAAKNQLFDKAERVTYRVDIGTGGLNRSYKSIDDAAPGLRELHDALFKLQAEVRNQIPGFGPKEE